ncbi:LA_2272/LA_2273 family lipoprotein [Leptospira ellisii]
MNMTFNHSNIQIFFFRSALLSIAVSALLDCGVGGLRGEKAFVRVPVKTETEVLRFNLLYGEVNKLYGINVGSINLVSEQFAGAQVGLANLSEGKTYGAQLAVYNSAKKGGFSIQVGGINRVSDGGAGIQIGGYNRGSNGPFPIMIVANYCYKAETPEEKTEIKTTTVK